MLITIKRYHNQAKLHLASGMFMFVYAELEFSDSNTGPTCLRNQLLDWQGVLTFDRPLSPDNAFALSTLYEDPRLQLFNRTTGHPRDKFYSLPVVPCEIGDVTLTKQQIKICAKGPRTEQSLSQLLTNHYQKLASEGAHCAD